MNTKIYHNPRCQKSRQTLAILEEQNQTPEIVQYLVSAPTAKEISDIVQMLGISPLQLIRKGEKIFKEQYKGQNLTDKEWIQAMVDHPILIERPIVVKGNQAVIGRPPEKVLDIL